MALAWKACFALGLSMIACMWMSDCSCGLITINFICLLIFAPFYSQIKMRRSVSAVCMFSSQSSIFIYFLLQIGFFTPICCVHLQSGVEIGSSTSVYQMRDAFTVEEIEYFPSLLTVLNHLVNRWLVAHVALWLLGSFLSSGNPWMVLLHCGYIIYVMSFSATMVVSRRMELILGTSEEAILGLLWRIVKSLRNE